LPSQADELRALQVLGERGFARAIEPKGLEDRVSELLFGQCATGRLERAD